MMLRSLNVLTKLWFVWLQFACFLVVFGMWLREHREVRRLRADLMRALWREAVAKHRSIRSKRRSE